MALSDMFRGITPVRDTDEQLRSHILWFIFIRVILFTLLLGITYLLQSKDKLIILPPSFVIITFLLILYGYSIGSALLLQKRTKHLRRFGLIQLLSDTFFMALLVYATGCSQSIFTAVFILPIIAGGLVLYRIGGLITASAATIFYGSLLTLEYFRIIPRYFSQTRYFPVEDFLVGMNVFAVYGLVFFLIALLSGMLAQRLRRAEDALTQAELQLDRLSLLYKQIFDDIMTGIITVDNSERITSFNPAAEGITGYTQQEMMGRRLSDIFPGFVGTSSERQVTDLRRKDGVSIRVGYSSSALRDPGGSKSGDDPCDNCRVITLQDISRIEEMEEQMRRAEKMAAIGEMSASIAHDFRNPLAAISGSAQVLSMELGAGKEETGTTGHNLTRIILRETDRMAKTITNFLDYARPPEPAPEWFNLRRLVFETVENIKREEYPESIIEADIPPELDIHADRQLLQLALCHLLRNSCHASRDTREAIRVTAHELTEGDRLIIEVLDRGEGFSSEMADKLTEPFFTTREDTAGLGLAIVRQIVENHGGELEITGSEGEGCHVRVTLPQPGATLEQS
ncbi:MAG: ATP-binding protein [Desulfobulbaceae bacterium]